MEAAPARSPAGRAAGSGWAGRLPDAGKLILPGQEGSLHYCFLCDFDREKGVCVSVYVCACVCHP